MKYVYLYKYMASGYGEEYCTYRPFTTRRELTQEKADELTLQVNKLAKRCGSGIDDLHNAVPIEYDMQVYNCVYRNPNVSHKDNLDPVPKDFQEWEIIESIMGNY